MPYVQISDERVFYAYHASALEKAPSVLLVHGAGGSHLHWGYEVRSLLEANVYAVDLPGHGRSGGSGRCSVAAYVESILGFMNVLELEHAVVVGHSMGSAIALTLGLDHSECIEGLVLIGSGARLRVLPAILQGLLSDFDATVQSIVSYCYGSGATEQMKRLGFRQMLAVGARVLHDDFVACDSFDVMGRLESLRAPTLIITGAEDAMTPPKYAQYLVEHIEGAQLTLIEGAGHMVMLEQAGPVAQAIARFLEAL